MNEQNPVLVNVWRGDMIESRHSGAFAVVDTAGNILESQGDIHRNIYARSSLKPVQALWLMESGAADRFALNAKQLAIACASHGGEEQHTGLVNDWLATLGLSVESLECGVHRPSYGKARYNLTVSGQAASALHNNCSGKHTGFLCACVHSGIDPVGYINPDHPAQRAITRVIEETLECKVSDQIPSIDGCGIPLYGIPLERLANGLAGFSKPGGSNSLSQQYRNRIVKSMMVEPFYVAGTDRFCTRTIEKSEETVVVKTGAEGVYIGIMRDAGIGIALKIDDGATRAAEVLMADLLSRYTRNNSFLEYLKNETQIKINNVAGNHVGNIMPAKR